MEKDIRKVKITMDGIKRDVSVKKNLSTIIMLTIAIPLLIWLIIQAVSNLSVSQFFFFGWQIIFAVSIFVLSYFLIMHSALYTFIAFKKGRITIKRDRVVEVKERNGRKGLVIYDCVFSSRIKTGKTTKSIVYSTSNRTKEYEGTANEMDGDWVGKIGDEYYLIFLGKKKNPSMIYNTRYFYIEGDENE